jgi:glycerophosphoryl diester phosphodiesterase
MSVNARFERVAHRGGSRLAPENTMGAFRHALTMPIDAIEFDVQMSRDGQPIVFHDATVDRVTNGTGNILDLDFAYLRSLNASAHFPAGWPQNEQIPTLREVLALARNRVRVSLEVKSGERDGIYARYPQIVETVLREVRALNMLDQVLFISFDWQALQDIKRIEPSATTGANVSADLWNPQGENALEQLVQQLTAFGCEWINLDHTLFTTEILAAAHKHDLKLGLWTVNTLEEMQKYANAGVDALTSDRPDLFAQVV